MTRQIVATADLPETLCENARRAQTRDEHVPHVVYAPGTTTRTGWCPGHGTFATVVAPPANPFVGIDS
jgi:hypothetical protein